MVARELLDIGEPRQAFALCAAAAPASVPAKVDAAFHAGWIALRFLGDAEEAAKRFDAANAVAATPLSIARAGYWRGRAAEALGRARRSAPLLRARRRLSDRLLRPARRRAARARRARLARARRRRRARSARRGDARRRLALRRRPRRSRQRARPGRGRPVERRSAARRARRRGGGARRRRRQRRLRQDRHRTRLRPRRLRLPAVGRAAIRAARGFGRPAERLRGGAAGERVRAPGRLRAWAPRA